MDAGLSNKDSWYYHTFRLKDYKDNCDDRPPFAECEGCTPEPHGPGPTGCDCATMQAHRQQQQKQGHSSTSSLCPEVPAFQPVQHRNDSYTQQFWSSRNISYGGNEKFMTRNANRGAGPGFHRGIWSTSRFMRSRGRTPTLPRQHTSSGPPYGRYNKPIRISSLGSPRRASASLPTNLIGPPSPNSCDDDSPRNLEPPIFKLYAGNVRIETRPQDYRQELPSKPSNQVN